MILLFLGRQEFRTQGCLLISNFIMLMKNIFSVIVIVISIATFVLFVRPQYAEVKKMEIQSSELDGVLDNARKLQRLRDGLLQKQQEITGSDISRLEKLIPENSDNVKLILEFQKIAEQYNLQIETASSSKDDEEEPTGGQNFDIETKDYGIITIDFSLSGSYNDFVDFLESIEKNLRLADVRSMSLAPVGGDNIDSYTYNLTIDTYWLKDNI